jgi:O-antigen ligase
LFFSVFNGFLPFPPLLINIFQYSFIALGLLDILSTTHKIIVESYTKWGLLFLVVMLVSLVYTPDKEAAINYSILPFFIQLVIYIVMINLIEGDEQIELIINVYSLIGFLFSFMCITLYANDLFSGHRFGYSVDRNPNEIMLQLMIPACFLFYKSLKSESIKYRYLLGAVLCVVVMLCTGSKKTILVLLFPIVFLLFRKGKNRFLRLFLLLTAMIIGFVSIFRLDFLYGVLGTRIESLLNLSRDISQLSVSDTDAVRMLMRNRAFGMFLSSPMWGNGCESFRVLSGYNTYSHNNYTELLASYGVIGTIIYYYLPVNLIINSLKEITKEKKRDIEICCIFSLLLIYFLIDWGSVTTYSKYNMFLFMFCSVVIKYRTQKMINVKNEVDV